jgi:hypothetical protein
MAPPSATHDVNDVVDTGASIPTSKHDQPATKPLEPGLTKKQADADGAAIPSLTGPVYEDPYKEREYQKGRLALAFRIFAKYGFDEGVAGHITLRVRH